MKKLSGIFFGLFMVCLFSVQAGAQNSYTQVEQRKHNAQLVNAYYYHNTPQQWVTHVQGQQVNSQNVQVVQNLGANDGVEQQLKQFSQQTQGELNNFRKK